MGDLIDRYGYATYGGNSHFFADADEGWILIEFSGGKGLWIAERVGPDEIRMSYPGYILEIPLDFAKQPDRYRGSRNFVSFAVEQKWYDPKSGKPFDVNAVYQSGKGRSPAVRVIEERLRRRVASGKLTLREFMDTVRDPLVSVTRTGTDRSPRSGPERHVPIKTCYGSQRPARSQRHSCRTGLALKRSRPSTASTGT